MSSAVVRRELEASYYAWNLSPSLSGRAASMGVDAAYASRSRFAALQSLREAAGLVAKFGSASARSKLN